MTSFKIGKNAIENWKLFKEDGQKDWWFHLNADSSPYVIVRTEESKLCKEEIKEAALMVKNGSKWKGRGKVKIVYTQISNLKKGKKVGEVFIKSNKKCNYINV
jgi:predicted ribosome quality control (RQC) complex YloA/Tae2 family protein